MLDDLFMITYRAITELVQVRLYCSPQSNDWKKKRKKKKKLTTSTYGRGKATAVVDCGGPFDSQPRRVHMCVFPRSSTHIDPDSGCRLHTRSLALIGLVHSSRCTFLMSLVSSSPPHRLSSCPAGPGVRSGRARFE